MALQGFLPWFLSLFSLPIQRQLPINSKFQSVRERKCTQQGKEKKKGEEKKARAGI